MELIRSIYNLRPEHRGCVATIGKFDGVHLGHQQLLKQLQEQARLQGLPALVILFEPHPAEFFAAEKAPARLYTLAAKLKYLAEQGVDRVLCLAFNEKLSSMTADDFVGELLVNKLNIAHFVVGDDFRFGKGRAGSFSFLQKQGEVYGFSVANTLTYKVDGQRVSSTKIRQALADHNWSLAQKMLSRPFSITGRVMHGQQLARTFGVPTANIKITQYNQPLQGVYTVKVVTAHGDILKGVANIGKRPSIAGLKPILEVHIFDFNDEIYGQKLTVEFQSFLRKEQKFADLEQLKEAILNDVEMAKRHFNL